MRAIKLISTLCLVSLVSLVSFAGPETLRLETDKFEYNIGDQAFLSAWYIPESKNPDIDVVFKMKVNGDPVEVLNVAGGRGLAITQSLILEENVCVVEVYLQDKRKVMEYEKSIISLKKHIVETQGLLENESDISIRAQLNAILDRDTALVLSLTNRISLSRKKIDERSLVLNAVSVKMKSGWSDALVVKFDRESRIYNAGDVMNVEARVLNEIRDKNGLHEIWIDGFIEGTGTADELWMDYKVISDLSYRLVSPEYTSLDVGRRRLITRLWSRPFKQSASLGSAIVDVKKNAAELQALKRSSSDPIEISYFSNRIAYMETFATRLDVLLDNAWGMLSDEYAEQFDIQ